MRKITITIETVNAAFEDDPTEAGRILHDLADCLASENYFRDCNRVTLWDYNGNDCGDCIIEN